MRLVYTIVQLSHNSYFSSLHLSGPIRYLISSGEIVFIAFFRRVK